ncbi:unnamed protein product, partial [Rotaria sp. Silwood2]
MEDFKLDIMIDSGPAARSIPIKLEKFTLIGATTRQGLLSSPMLDRFGINCHLDYYSSKELVNIVKRSARLMNIEISDEGAEVHTIAAPSSLAIIFASVVLPSPGGPVNKTWCNDSP